MVLGTAGGGLNTGEENYRAVYEEGKNRDHPLVVPKLMNNAATSHVSMETACGVPPSRWRRAAQVRTTPWALPSRWSAPARAMLSGGSEAMLCFGGVKAWEGLRVMSRDACHPFSVNRNGMMQGEGAGIFKNWDGAAARGADILAEVVGFSMAADAQDIVMPSAQGANRAILGAVRDAGLNAEEICCINAHGTGTAANDKTECAEVAHAFGDHADRLMISSTRAMHGHVIGGTGAIELLACVHGLGQGIIAPTIGYEEPDPECALDAVLNVARKAKVGAVLSNAFAFGGLNAVLALKRA